MDLKVTRHPVTPAWQELWPQKRLTGSGACSRQTLQVTSPRRSPAVGPLAVTAVHGALSISFSTVTLWQEEDAVKNVNRT